jgi:hypothetical protein
MNRTQYRLTGEITITPPLSWTEIRSPRRRGLQDLRFRTEDQPAPPGTLPARTVTGHAVTPVTSDPYMALDVLPELQSIVDAYGHGHAFAGRITAADASGEQWELTVRDGKAVRAPLDAPAPAAPEDDHAR